MKKQDPDGYSPLALAFIGDDVFDIVVRSVVLARGNCSAERLHLKCSRIVKASSQAAMIRGMRDELSEREAAIYRRGRNAKSHTTAKNASAADYREATAFECLIGWLYLRDEWERILELISEGMERLTQDDK